jgi:N-acetylmuramic acid 6-phosphate etherase
VKPTLTTPPSRGPAAGLDDAARAEAHRKAKQFIELEQQFHLGMLPTEQSHPKTRGMAETSQRDLPAAIHMLQSVDDDILPKAKQVLAGPEFQRMVAAMRRALEGNGHICFSGCGATGRLSILLEAAWREFWQDARRQHPDITAKVPNLEDRATSIMTGGDYALIRAVESFEDHMPFGRQQAREDGLQTGDVLVAITEGGETSSVIGTVWQAVENGAEVFFLFNNPADVLARHIERSRKVIEDARITKLDLSSGPMALTGSTRMQATTSELLVAGAALEIALTETLRARLNDDELARLNCGAALPAARLAGNKVAGVTPAPRNDYAEHFARLLDELGRPDAVNAMAAMVEFEEQLYLRKGLVTYLADRCLLDIFTDTTERSPTFMLPRFRTADDRVSPPSWAFVKDPLRPTAEAWREVLHRGPRCLSWDAALYHQLNAPAKLKADPPRLSADELFKFEIGNENDGSRYATADNAAVLVVEGDEVARLARPGDPLRAAFTAAARPFAQRAVLAIGPAPPTDIAAVRWHVDVRPAATPLRIFARLANKLVLNTVSTVTMARLGRVASNWMVCVEPTNKKLIDRGTRLVAELAGVDYNTACHALFETIEELSQTVKPGQERPSPVALTIERLKDK